MLVFKNVTFSYPNARAILASYSVSIDEKEIVFVVGVNGTGKTTFLKLAAGILLPQSGRVLYHMEKLNIGYHQQDVHLANKLPLSVEEMVLMGRLSSRKVFFSKEDREKVQQCLAQVNLVALAKKNVHSLSRGQFQRVLLARVLAADPSLIIMDEPEAFLDAVSRNILSELILQLSKNITFLISSHNFDFIFSLAHRVICITNPHLNQEDHKFFEFLEKQNTTIRVEHLCSKHEESIK